MKKEFKLVLQLLGMAAFTVNEQGALLTEEQLQKIEDQLQQAKQEHDDAAAAVAALDAISDNVKSIDGLKNKVMAVKTVLDRTPLVAPDSQTPLSKTEDEKKAEELKKCAVDEINNEAKNL